MGGFKEDTVKQEPVDPAKTTVADRKGDVIKQVGREGLYLPPLPPLPAKDAQEVRHHETGNEMHFHDDIGKLKAALSASDWMAARDAIAQMQPWQRIDFTNNTIYRAIPYYNQDTKTIDVQIEIRQVKLGPMLQSLKNKGHFAAS